MLQRKNFKLVVMFLIMSMILNGCIKTSTTNSVPSIKVTPEPTQKQTPEQTPEPTPEQTLEPTSTPKIIDTQNTEGIEEYDGYYYRQLENSNQKVMFAALYTFKRKGYIGFKNVTIEDLKKVFEALKLEDNSGSYDFQYYEENDVIFIETLKTLARKKEKSAKEAANQILATIDGDSKEEIIIQIYNWCATNIVYDNKGTNKRNLFGAFIERTCNCVGYAKAFAYLCKQKGIYSICVSNGKHMWNYVLLNDQWYAVDATAAQEGTTRDLMQGKEILSEEEHVPGEDFVVPELVQKSLYPDQKKAKETIKYLNENLETCDKQIQKIEGYISSEKYQVNYEKYVSTYNLYIEIRALLTEMVRKAEDSIYHRYLNTEEYNEANNRLQTLISRVNSYDW